MKILSKNRKGLTPVLSMVLLLMIAVAAVGIMYGFVMKLQKGTQNTIQKQTGSIQQKIQQQINTQFNIESVYKTSDDHLGISLRNTGNSEICFKDLTVYVNGVPTTGVVKVSPASDCITPGQIMILNVTAYPFPSLGQTDNIKIASTVGTFATYTCSITETGQTSC